MFPSTTNAKKHEPVPGSVEMAKSMAEVEELLGYEFKNRRLLEEALTHSSHAESPSYQRLEFVGDAALGLAITKYLYLNNPDVGPGRLTILRAANIRNERLARVAVRHGLYRFLRRNSSTTSSLDEKVRKFAAAIESEVGERLHCPVKAPKVLADIIESVAAAVYVDCDFDLDTLWEVFKGLLEPLVTMETLHEQSVTTLCELCQKLGKVLDFKNWMKGEMNMINVFIDGELIGIGCSEQKEIAKVLAAKDALEKLWASDAIVAEADEVAVSLSGSTDNKEYKQALNELCSKKHWPLPNYRVDKEQGPGHDKRFRCAVQVETTDGILVVSGDFRPRVKDAENSAAAHMLINLRGGEEGDRILHKPFYRCIDRLIHWLMISPSLFFRNIFCFRGLYTCSSGHTT